MSRWKPFLLALCAALLLGGCLYADVTTPYDTDLDETSLGTKVGEASAQSFLWLIAFGDSGTAAAARDGGIRIINHMDRRTFVILFGLYTRNTTIVYGD